MLCEEQRCPGCLLWGKMQELVPNTTDAAVEKHVPVIQIDGSKVTVTVGSAEHPMIPEHYIQWIALATRQGNREKRAAAGTEAAGRVYAL